MDPIFFFYVVREEDSCFYRLSGPSTSHHDWRQPKPTTNLLSTICDLYGIPNHLISQCPELRAFNCLYPIPYITQSTKHRHKHHTFQICAGNHHVWNCTHLSCFHYLLRFMCRFIMKNSDLVRSDTELSDHTPPSGNEASRSILCVFEERWPPTTK